MTTGRPVRGARRRAGHPGADARHDARLLGRPRALRGDVLVALARAVGPRRLGEIDATASGTSTAAPTTRSRSPASASGRPRSRAPPSATRPSSRPPRSASRTRSRARRSSSCASCDPARRTTPTCGRRSRATSPTSSASRSSRRSSRSSGRCRRPAPARSCGGSSGRPGSVSTRATCPRSTIPRRSRPSAPYPWVDDHGPRPRSATSSPGTTSTDSSACLAERLERPDVRRDARDHPRRDGAGRDARLPARIARHPRRRRRVLRRPRAARPAPDVPAVPGRPAAARPARPDRRRGLGQRHDDPCRDRARPPGRRHPVTAVLHYKPERSVVPGRPDVHAVETDRGSSTRSRPAADGSGIGGPT